MIALHYSQIFMKPKPWTALVPVGTMTQVASWRDMLQLFADTHVCGYSTPAGLQNGTGLITNLKAVAHRVSFSQLVTASTEMPLQPVNTLANF